MRSAWRGWAILALGVFGLVGCASAPQTRLDRASLIERADHTLARMEDRIPALENAMSNAAGVVVFPEVGEAGFLVGASQGVGVVYEDGRPIGFATMRSGSVGAIVGGHSFSQVIVLRTEEAMQRLRVSNFDVGAEANATALGSGASNSQSAGSGVSVFIDNEQGLMADASVRGQFIDYQPLERGDEYEVG